jgi:hypothetical protein
MAERSFERTRLWKSALAAQPTHDPEQAARDRLRVAFLGFRERCATIAAEIPLTLRDYTVHDITHIDALWEMADLIVGSEISLTPTEAFVLGGAFLIHDLGNGLAAFSEGIEQIRATPAWGDAVTALFVSREGRQPTTSEISQPPQEIEREATAQVLRRLHAAHAERLPTTRWKIADGQEMFLLDDVDLRTVYGPSIGRIAYSHWWSIDRLAREIGGILGAPVWCPPEWTVDREKIACILRAADAAHLDERRAPRFLQAVRRPAGESGDHWTFQGRLQRPRLATDRLVYTSGQPFEPNSAGAWWLCCDALRLVDRELRQVDSFLSDRGVARFAARGVAGVESPDRLVAYVPTTGWTPVDAQVRVTEVARLVEHLGGSQLYGDDPSAPLRELLQNGIDAIEARRFIESRGQGWGKISVALNVASNEIEVVDTGIGMSREVLTGPLLNFGTSYWGSELMRDQFPGLMSRGFRSIGKFGIGFFSVFMWGDQVRVVTRRYDDAPRDTQVLEFRRGLGSRPLLRPAMESEWLRDGGTRITVRLRQSPHSFNGLLYWGHRDVAWTLKQRCGWLCPASPVNIYAREGGGAWELAVGGGDWLRLPGRDLLDRIWQPTQADEDERPAKYVEALAARLETLTDPQQRVVGRACIVDARVARHLPAETGAITDGGIRVGNLNGIAGILFGHPTRASRDEAIPSLDPNVACDWASRQGAAASKTIRSAPQLESIAQAIRRFKAPTGKLPIAYSSKGWLTVSGVSKWGARRREVWLVYYHRIRKSRKFRQRLQLNHKVLAVEVGSKSFAHGSVGWHSWPTISRDDDGMFLETLARATLEALASAWHVQVEEVIAASDFNEEAEEEEGRHERTVGTLDGNSYSLPVVVVRRPTARA